MADGHDSSQQARSRKFRPEIHGLRGVDALIIAGGHIWTPAATGGIGMFFCLAGTLVLAGMHADATSGDKRHGRTEPRPFEFLLRSLSRILPEAALCIALTVMATQRFLPALARATLEDASWAMAFGLNWRFVANSADYEARDFSTSPLLLFWSIAVIVQVYTAFAAFYSLLVRSGTTLQLRRSMIDACGVAAQVCTLLMSAAFALHQDSRDTGGYFDTRRWVWMFCTGALVGRALQSTSAVSNRVSRMLSTLAFALGGTLAYHILVVRFVPRPLRLAPMGMMLLVTCASTISDVGEAGVDSAAARKALGCPNPLVLLRSQALQRLGRLSYWIFLLHWPLLMLFKQLIGLPDGEAPLPFVHGLLVLGATIVMAEGGSWLFAAARDVSLEHPQRRLASRAVLLILALFATATYHVLARIEASHREQRASQGAQGRHQVARVVSHLSTIGGPEEGEVGSFGDQMAEVQLVRQPSPSAKNASHHHRHPALASPHVLSPSPTPAAAARHVPSSRWPYAVDPLRPGAHGLPQPSAPTWKQAVQKSNRALLAMTADQLVDAVEYAGYAEAGRPLKEQDTWTPRTPRLRVRLVGASHTYQWQPALFRLAQRHSWRFEAIYFPMCDAYDAELTRDHRTRGVPGIGIDAKCIKTLRETHAQLARDPANVTFVLGTYFSLGHGERGFDLRGKLYQATRGTLEAAGTHLVAFRDTPRFSSRVGDCIINSHGRDVEDCAFQPEAMNISAYREAVTEAPRTTYVDLNHFVCPWDVKGSLGHYIPSRHCPPVVGNVSVWRDKQHLTRVYSATLAPALEAVLRAARPNAKLSWVDRLSYTL